MQAPTTDTRRVVVSLEVIAHWRNESRQWSDSKMFDDFRSAATHFQLTRQQANVSQRDTLVDLVLRQHRRLDITPTETSSHAPPIQARL